MHDSHASPRPSPPLPEPNSPIPRQSSATFRAPFLSPASRPSSSVWSPPSYPVYPVLPNLGQSSGPDSPAGSSSALALPKAKPPLPSTRLTEKLTKEDKPWLSRTPTRERLSYWITFCCILLGVVGAAALCYFGATSVDLLNESDLCLVLEDDFNSGSLDESVWKRDVQLGGFGNGEFQITTNSDDNLKVQNGQLYIIPTLTSDSIGTDKIFDGFTYNVDGCTTDNKTACSAKSNSGTHTVINPAMSARINTAGTKSIKYGKVEVKAKNPRGDWLWPAIWMLPVDDTYGAWPLSGEIDLMEARGNLNTYGAQGLNFVRSSLNYGPLDSLITFIFGWWEVKRGGFNEGFHTYTLEWTADWMRIYVDSRLQAMLDLTIKKEKDSFWNRGHFPQTAQNGSTQAVVQNIYENQGGGWNAPFDQQFYLILDLAVGGTSGWFPDGVGNKAWHDGSATAMFDFASDQDNWSRTWPTNVDDRAFRIDSVKMWQLGGC
ncbi:concanavalin A-like lectin/glucanase [Dendrothele bispora CBS 962.96]|uniref:Concanavalin A-like lectin/glucanase n=1 Tax=Dendrothele bispora (strain CBS 962.96) TaxID=1314807 RepID=A0A4S8L2F1_DENBC|nr:concanavalin A-like lectin/glucanase [Dendrothele bispora CBS 962.96]